MQSREQMNIVIVGHVDHGKSTVIGRLLADTNSLPQGKLEQVKAQCARNARPFEYAFLLDALKDEQAQGITIDVARCFFKTALRDYILIDAPGHIEFLKNMVTGASRADAALLVIDAHEGIRENSRRHGYLLSMLGLKQVVIIVNKMDLVNYDMKIFENVKSEYTKFLLGIGVTPTAFVPVCARDGENIATKAPWYSGKTVLEHIDAFVRSAGVEKEPLRLPVQDIYKFTEENDERRIVVGTIETGTVHVGDEVTFFPSRKKAQVKSVEVFNVPVQASAVAGQATGITLTEELYIKPGEIVCRKGELEPMIGTRFRANLFWMGKAPFVKNKKYKLKIASARVTAQLSEIRQIIDASEMGLTLTKQQIERHDVAECIIETLKPIAFDSAQNNPGTGRFVIVDNYEIAAGGIILDTVAEQHTLLDAHLREREIAWESGGVNIQNREQRFGHKPKFVLICGTEIDSCKKIGLELERVLFDAGFFSYYVGLSSLEHGLGADSFAPIGQHDDQILRLGELARLLTESGQIFITALSGIDEDDITILKQLNHPYEIAVVACGSLQAKAVKADIIIEDSVAIATAAQQIYGYLQDKAIIPDYSI